METLIFAVIASYNAQRQQEPVVAQLEEFQPFDLQALRNSTDNTPRRLSSRREALRATNRLTSSTMDSKSKNERTPEIRRVHDVRAWVESFNFTKR
jgi:hypothetical protein